MANYPVPYQSGYGYGGNYGVSAVYPQMAGTQMPYAGQAAQTVQANQNGMGLKWVDGEVGAKAYQMPAGWPANQPIALWDTNDTVIWLKSVNQLGMPNPLQKAHYTLEGVSSGEKAAGYSGSGGAEIVPDPVDLTQYVKKEDLERMKQDLIDTIGQMGTGGTGVRRRVKEEE